jgi:hypothetical protein
MGAPNSLQDEDISVPFPQPNRSIQKSTTLEMHVKLSRLIAKVLNSKSKQWFLLVKLCWCGRCEAVYAVDGRLDSSFLRNVQNMLRQLATLGEELNASVELDLNSLTPLSRVSATINLCYHQVWVGIKSLIGTFADPSKVHCSRNSPTSHVPPTRQTRDQVARRQNSPWDSRTSEGPTQGIVRLGNKIAPDFICTLFSRSLR